MSKPTLVYWDLRGLAHPIRFLLHYVGQEYEEKLYEIGPAPDFNRDCWYSVKYKLGLDFPNLPYYVDGDVKITQSNAILRYIAKKHNLCGSSDAEQLQVDMLMEEAMDFRNEFIKLCYNKNYAQLKDQYAKDLAVRLANFEKYMSNKKWFAGDNLTVVDFPMYELFDQHLVWDPNCLNNCPNLQAFQTRFEALPAIKAYRESPNFQKSPINNKNAGFVG